MMRSPELAADVVQGIHDILFRCLDEMWLHREGDMVEALHNARQQNAYALKHVVQSVGGNERVNAAVIEIFDAFCEQLQKIPADGLVGEEASHYVSGIFSQYKFLAGVKMLCDSFSKSLQASTSEPTA